MATNAKGFPAHRITADGRHIYRIESDARFIEIQRVGRRWLVHTVEASAYPEKLRIVEMMNGDRGRYRSISEEEWERYHRSAAVDPPPLE